MWSRDKTSSLQQTQKLYKDICYALEKYLKRGLKTDEILSYLKMDAVQNMLPHITTLRDALETPFELSAESKTEIKNVSEPEASRIINSLRSLKQLLINLQLANLTLESNQNNKHYTTQQLFHLGLDVGQILLHATYLQSNLHQLTCTTLKKIDRQLTILTHEKEPEYTLQQNLYLLVDYIIYLSHQYQQRYVIVGVPDPSHLTYKKLELVALLQENLITLREKIETDPQICSTCVVCELREFIYAIQNENKKLEALHHKFHRSPEEAKQQNLGRWVIFWAYIAPQSTLHLFTEASLTVIEKFTAKELVAPTAVSIPSPYVVPRLDRGIQVFS